MQIKSEIEDLRIFLITKSGSLKLKKINFVSKGDDYQILFTASKKKSRIIKRTFKSLGIKISKIGNISSGGQKSQVIDEKGNKIAIKNKGHFHNF